MHGSEVADISPRMITIVDQGAQMFVFLLGFVGYGAFTRRLKRGGAWANGM